MSLKASTSTALRTLVFCLKLIICISFVILKDDDEREEMEE